MKIQSALVAVLAALVANTGMAGDGLPNKSEKVKPAGFVRVADKEQNKVFIFSVPSEHDELLKSKEILMEKVAEGKIKEGDKEIVEVNQKLRVLVGLESAVEGQEAEAAKGVLLVNTIVDPDSKVSRESGKSDKACWGWGWGHGWGWGWGGGVVVVRTWGGCWGGWGWGGWGWGGCW